MIGTENNTIEQAYKNFVIKKKHPWIMGKTVFPMNNYPIKIYDMMASNDIIDPILSEIDTYINNYDFNSNEFEALII